ncbi:1-deoxy-D-xylulose-5-phosphate synthase [bacterium]|nr:1-deoxy-D-xylulose-5-phosphate synthase [bacterium]
MTTLEATLTKVRTRDAEVPILPRIQDPADLRALPEDALEQVCREVREYLINVVSRTGGHFSSNLGSVELTVALHYVFNTPYDKLIWDVGHQAYPHKILCGRRDRLHSIRQFGGLSGFPHYDESEHDMFMIGHAGTSISSAMGVCEACWLAGEDRKVVAVIGDGSLTAGMAFEAMNHAGHSNRAPIVVLNDNDMSIDPNVGALSSFLSRRRIGKTAQSIKNGIRAFLEAMGPMGENAIGVAKKLEEHTVGLVSPGSLFEALGFTYVGPIDGHDIHTLVDTLRAVKNTAGPVLVHALTVKGKGYAPAEADPLKYHGISKFDPAVGIVSAPSKKTAAPTYTDVFADAVVDMARKDTSVVGISAAMLSGTGLIKLMKTFPDRCYDVGIAEQHAVTFSAGLAKMGFKPIAAIYSTFLQRGFDQVVHDVLLQNLPVVFALDRGGLAGADGPSHHGAFDIAYLRGLPRIALMAPKDEAELRDMVYSAVEYRMPVALRYPRGNGPGAAVGAGFNLLPFGKGELLREGDDLVIVAYGNRVYPALTVAEALAKEGKSVAVINARFAKPLDAGLILPWAKKTRRVVTVEDGARRGGFGSAVLELLAEDDATGVRVRMVGLPDEFVEHGTQQELWTKYGIDEAGIEKAVRELLR